MTVRKLREPSDELDESVARHPAARGGIVEALRPLAYPIDQLRDLPGNPHHADVEAHMRSLRRFGQRLPLIARRIGDDAVVTAGNHRLEAARRLGWSEVAVVFVEEDASSAAAFAAADNHLAALGWDDPALLADLLMEVRQADRALYEATGYADADLAELLHVDDAKDRDGRSARQRASDQSEDYQSQWAVIVTCADEAEQLALLDRLVGEGLSCRALIS